MRSELIRKKGETVQNRITLFLVWLFCALVPGCAMEMPEVPKADLVITALSPVEYTSINQNSSLIVNYTWSIEKYDTGKKYRMQILLYDTNDSSAEMVKAFDINSASGSASMGYSALEFYNCFFGCVRKAALPFRLYFTIEQLNDSGSTYGTTLARSREYIYN